MEGILLDHTFNEQTIMGNLYAQSMCETNFYT